MSKTCNKCSDAITGIDMVTCRGYCGGTFHMNCSGVSRALLSYFTSNRKNLYWFCDECADLFENSHFRMISRQADEKSPLASLTTAIGELREEIKNLAPQTTAAPLTPLNWPMPAEQLRRSFKRFCGQDRIARPTGGDSRVGSKPLGESIVSVPICSAAANKEKFWLYISRIRPDVSTDAVLSMAKANLELEENPIVIKLIPRGMDIRSMNFVSFKIGVEPEMKHKALDPATWPEGLMFREFEDYGPSKFRQRVDSEAGTSSQLRMV